MKTPRPAEEMYWRSRPLTTTRVWPSSRHFWKAASSSPAVCASSSPLRSSTQMGGAPSRWRKETEKLLTGGSSGEGGADGVGEALGVGAAVGGRVVHLGG